MAMVEGKHWKSRVSGVTVSARRAVTTDKWRVYVVIAGEEEAYIEDESPGAAISEINTVIQELQIAKKWILENAT